MVFELSTSSTEMADHAGEETIGRYRLLEKIGHGKMAEVFKAKSFGVEGFEKTLVVKRILPDLTRSKAFADVFVHEAKLALRLSHANVVQIFDLGLVEQSNGGAYYIAMEYVAGVDLGTLLGRLRQREVALPLGMCVYIAAEAAKSLDHAHRRRDEQLRPLGILHRDLRPSNILVSWEGEVKVADFGIARAWEMLDPTRGARNVPLSQIEYLSPEQVLGEPLDARSDLFSLGAVLYQLIANRTPFAAPTLDEVFANIADGSFAPLRSHRPEVPDDLAALVDGALARSRDHRFSDAGRMYEGLLSHLYSCGERFGASDLAELAASMREVSQPPAAFDVEQERPFRDTQAEVSLGADSLLPAQPITETIPKRITEPSVARASVDLEPDTSDRRVVSLLALDLGTSHPAVVERQRERLEPIIARYGGRFLEQHDSRLLVVFGSFGTRSASSEMAVRCALLALRHMGAVGLDGALRMGTEPDVALDEGPAHDPHEPSHHATSPSERPGFAIPLEPAAGVHTGWARVWPDGTPLQDDSFATLTQIALQMSQLRRRSCGVSLSAARKIRGQFVFDAPDEVAKSPGLVIRDLKAPTDVASRFVGRKDELKLLGEILSFATRKRTQVISLTGPAGIGKTRLLLETRRRLQRGSYRVGFYLATCRSEGPSVPFSGLAEMLAVLSGIQGGDPPERVVELTPRFRALGLHDDEVSALLGLLGAPEYGRSGIMPLTLGFGRTVTSLCSEDLQVFAWDNAERIDDRTLEVLTGAIARLAPTRAVFIFSGRDLPSELFDAHPTTHHRIALQGVTSDQLCELVMHRAGSPEQPEELLAYCGPRARGNPLHAEELIRHMIATGAITQTEGAPPTVRLPEVGTSPALPDLLLDRARRLPDQERCMVELASVLGDPAPLEVLAEMSGVSWPTMERAIDALEEYGVLRRTGASTVAFVAPAFREVVLHALPAQPRARMHQAAAKAYTTVLGARALDQVDRIAVQLLAAGNTDRAATMYAGAAARDAQRGRYEMAVRALSRALCHADLETRSPHELCTWVRELAALAYRARTAPGIAELASSLLTRIDSHPDLTRRVHARIDLASILVSTHELDAADAHLAAAHALAQGAPNLLRQTILTEAELLRRRGDFRQALERFEQLAVILAEQHHASHVPFRAEGSPANTTSVELAGANDFPRPGSMSRMATMSRGAGLLGVDEDGASGSSADAGAASDAEVDMRATIGLAVCRAAAGDQAGALGALEAATQTTHYFDGDVAYAERSRIRLIIALFCKDFETAVREGQHAVALARGTGLTYEVALSLNLWGQALMRVGDAARAYACLRQSYALCEEVDEERLGAHSRALVAYLEAKADADAAAETIGECARYASAHQYLWDETNCRYVLARLHRDRGDLDAATAEFERCEALATTIGYRLVAGECGEALLALRAQ